LRKRATRDSGNSSTGHSGERHTGLHARRRVRGDGAGPTGPKVGAEHSRLMCRNCEQTGSHTATKLGRLPNRRGHDPCRGRYGFRDSAHARTARVRSVGEGRRKGDSMTSVARAPSASIEWQSVSSRHPCRVCGAFRGCHFHADDSFVCCVNHQSERPLTNGAWLHRIELAAPPPASVLGGGRP
jgi:hypothetical protein